MAVSQDFPDFTTPIGFVESDTVPANTPAVLGNAGVLTINEVASASSVALNLLLPFGAVGDACALIVDWKTGGVIICREVITFHSAASYNNATQILHFQTPCRGAQLVLTFFTTGAGNLTISGATSNRVLDSTLLTHSGANRGANISDTSAFPIAAGGNLFVYVPPTTRAITVSAGYAIASGTVEVRALSLPGIIPTDFRLTLVTTSAAAGGAVIELAAPLTGTTVKVVNNDAGAHTGSLEVWDVS